MNQPYYLIIVLQNLIGRFIQFRGLNKVIRVDKTKDMELLR